MGWGQSGRGLPQSKPWRNYGAPRGGRRLLGTSPEGERSRRWACGNAENAGSRCCGEGDRILPPLRGGRLLIWLSRGVAARHALAYPLASLQDAAWLRPAPYLKLRNIQNRLFGFERKYFKVNEIGKSEEKKKTGYPRISGADGRTPLPEVRGIKAPEGWRSPRPGGQGSALHPPRQRVGEADRAVRMRRMPKSGGDFVSQVAAGELIMPKNCPEFGEYAGRRRVGVKAVSQARGRSPSPGGQSSAPVLRSGSAMARWFGEKACPQSGAGGKKTGKIHRGRPSRDGAEFSSRRSSPPGSRGPCARRHGKCLKHGSNDQPFVERILFRKISPGKVDSRRRHAYGCS